MARILLIDDEPHVRFALRYVLEQAGYGVVEASNGKEGLQLYREAPTDLVIIDLLMPEHGGLETIQKLAREYSTVKIIAMTGGRGDSNFLQTAELLGAKRILAKPFEPKRLLQVVGEELEVQEV